MRLLGAAANAKLSTALVDEIAIRSADVDRLADLHALEELRELSALGKLRVDVGEVDLHDEVKVAVVVVARDGRVRSGDQLSVDGGGGADVLTRRQAEDVLRGGQAKAEAARIRGDLLLLNQRDGVLLLVVLQQLGRPLLAELFSVEGVDEVGGEADGQSGDGQ